ncbi:MAG: response regulator transcription factor [Sedimentisphaerales bacterium]
MIADDFDALRENIKSFVNKQPDIEVVGEARDGKTAVELAKNLSPDVILMDISMPKLSGIEAAGKILSNNAAARIIILSTRSDKRFVVAGFKAGVAGYVLKSSIFDDLLPAIRAVMANEFFLSPQIKDVEI